MARINELREPTRNHLGLNLVEAEVEGGSTGELKKIGEDLPVLEEDFSKKDYGLSPEVIKANKEGKNRAYSFLRKRNETYDTEVLTYDLTGEDLISSLDILAEEGSTSDFLINISQSGDRGLSNSLIRVDLKKDSKVKLVVVTDLHENSTNYQAITSIIGEGAELDLTYIELGAEKSFVSLKNFLDGDRSVLLEDGVYFKEKDEFLDLLTVNEHWGRDTESDTNFNGALKDRAKKNRKGVVDLKKGCRKADGKIADYSMMLSGEAINKSTPILLNEEKEVAGKHAASVGRLNPDMLFYIMSRGFSKKEAQSLMLEANFAPSLDKIENQELRDKLKNKVHLMNKREEK